MQHEDRYQIQSIRRRDFEELVAKINGDWVKLSANVPRDAKLRGVCFDFATDCFLLRWEHESFPVVMLGADIRHLPPMEIKAVRDFAPIPMVRLVDERPLVQPTVIMCKPHELERAKAILDATGPAREFTCDGCKQSFPADGERVRCEPVDGKRKYDYCLACAKRDGVVAVRKGVNSLAKIVMDKAMAEIRETGTLKPTATFERHGEIVESAITAWAKVQQQPKCECGGEAAGTTHSDWCPKRA